MEQPTPDAHGRPEESVPVESAGTHDTSPAAVALPPAVPHAGLRYTALRLAMFVVVGGALALVGLRGWQLLVLAVLLSGLVSLFALSRQRDAVAVNIERGMARRSARQRAADEALDAAEDAR